jgi:hypothetical protein
VGIQEDEKLQDQAWSFLDRINQQYEQFILLQRNDFLVEIYDLKVYHPEHAWKTFTKQYEYMGRLEKIP